MTLERALVSAFFPFIVFCQMLGPAWSQLEV